MESQRHNCGVEKVNKVLIFSYKEKNTSNYYLEAITGIPSKPS